MNIFYLDDDPQVCAQAYCDKHVNKMITETVQMLCTNFIRMQPKGLEVLEYTNIRTKRAKLTYYFGNIQLFAPSHANHPCTLWAGRSIENYMWLLDLGFQLIAEYDYRWPERRRHCRSRELLALIAMNCPRFPHTGFSPPAICVPDEFFIPTDPKLSYCAYYAANPKGIDMKWTRR
jgi:hypothetical protein